MAEQPQLVDISTLPYEQLVMLKNQFEQEVQGLAQLSGTLKVAASRFQNSIKALGQLKNSSEGAEILVPLTDSLYAPGALVDPGHCLVDVGTGFFIEKKTSDTIDYCNRKCTTVVEKINEADSELARKREGLQTIFQLIQAKQAQETRKPSA
ncbi:Prefoldin subunit 5 [Plasmodiophora brassicae]|uniref:Prefoldin subunit 5 n=1 Tax=Plasmodiophora brassicae TaxID=37360 RepID=A0A0G4IWW7_PLABS|nr:hypothetical protein PBRA_007567 [Plasmodiophora brassicae]SPR02077.1 unnamed protein product [Plasmodiophora brassicae]